MIRKFTLIILLATACQFSIAEVIKVVRGVPIIVRGTLINKGYRKSAAPPYTDYGYYLRFPKNTPIDCGDDGDPRYNGAYEPEEMSISTGVFPPDVAEEAEWEISIVCNFHGNVITAIKLHQPGLENGKKYKTPVEVADAWLTSLIAKAKAGDVNAQVELADAYSGMYHVTRDRELQNFWMQKSAEQGNSDAQVYMGHASNGDASINWFTKAVEQGDAVAAYHLGIRYSLGGNGVPQDNAKAIYWLSKSVEMGGDPSGHFYPEGELEIVKEKLLLDNISRAESGDAKAQAELAGMYKSGKGVSQDDKQAFDWYKKAAEQGDVNAQVSLANMYRSGEGVPEDSSNAIDWYTKAAEQGNAEAQYLLGEYYMSQLEAVLSPEWRQDYMNAKHWFTKAAEQGDIKSQTALGDIYSDHDIYGGAYHRFCFDGNLGFYTVRCLIANVFVWSQQDYKMAFNWYSKAAEQDDYRAQLQLAIMYSDGKGVTKSEEMADKWDRRSYETESKNSAREEAEKAVMISAGIKKWIVGKWMCRFKNDKDYQDQIINRHKISYDFEADRSVTDIKGMSYQGGPFISTVVLGKYSIQGNKVIWAGAENSGTYTIDGLQLDDGSAFFGKNYEIIIKNITDEAMEVDEAVDEKGKFVTYLCSKKN